MISWSWAAMRAVVSSSTPSAVNEISRNNVLRATYKGSGERAPLTLTDLLVPTNSGGCVSWTPIKKPARGTRFWRWPRPLGHVAGRRHDALDVEVRARVDDLGRVPYSPTDVVVEQRGPRLSGQHPGEVDNDQVLPLRRPQGPPLWRGSRTSAARPRPARSRPRLPSARTYSGSFSCLSLLASAISFWTCSSWPGTAGPASRGPPSAVPGLRISTGSRP